MADLAGKEKVVLSRLYPFGEKTKVGTTEVTELTVKELNGHKNIIINEQIEKGKMGGYVQISVSTGIAYEESLELFDKDIEKLSGVLQAF